MEASGSFGGFAGGLILGDDGSLPYKRFGGSVSETVYCSF